MPPKKVTATIPNIYSIVLRATPTPAPVAITGNIFIDPTSLPPRPGTIPEVLAHWDVLNTVIAYVAPAATGT